MNERVAAFLLAALLTTGCAHAAPAERAVMIGEAGPDLDGCLSYGEVTGLDPAGDNFLAVRAAPDRTARELDRIGPGKGVAMCDYVEGWVGIVYGENPEQDCGTGSPVAEKQAYAGPCKSGWVSADYVTLIAG